MKTFLTAVITMLAIVFSQWCKGQTVEIFTDHGVVTNAPDQAKRDLSMMPADIFANFARHAEDPFAEPTPIDNKAMRDLIEWRKKNHLDW
jgi:hypothetical protein